eukprot:TRINITY_DN9066_c0_g1_i1.p1 TRINITY_DN9066_c0_g1~~TRINITY_DN9066_c0_g1_i1.p1  ORF type:complete len:267 (+),score=44.34 TRINITY_DN9066_c0_g1_i1:77-802(+)
MVIVSKLDELKPPGGSNFGGSFAKTAFASYVYPKGRHLERDGTQRVDHSETKHVAGLIDPSLCQAANVHYAHGHFTKNSRLHHNYAKTQEKAQPKKSLSSSASSPALARQAEPVEEPIFDEERPPSQRSQGSSAQAPGADITDLSEFAAAQAMNSRWYPHPSLTRGTLKLSAPSALAFGVDPLKDTGHQCPFFEGKKHRFKDVQSLPSATLKVPTKSMKWTDANAWNDPSMHASTKITSFR